MALSSGFIFNLRFCITCRGNKNTFYQFSCNSVVSSGQSKSINTLIYSTENRVSFLWSL